ncbi:hypothetical protein M2368_003805, partial [Arthrobacter sp. JUb119]|nr:hypothetical protein [Arthrobacter sp. JUb119]
MKQSNAQAEAVKPSWPTAGPSAGIATEATPTSSKALFATTSAPATARRGDTPASEKRRVSDRPKANNATQARRDQGARQGGTQCASTGKERGRQAPSSLPP